MADGETKTNPEPENAPDATGTGVADAGTGGGTETADPVTAGNGGGKGAAAHHDGDDEPSESIEEVGKTVNPNVAKETQPIQRDPEAREVIRSDLARGLLWLL